MRLYFFCHIVFFHSKPLLELLDPAYFSHCPQSFFVNILNRNWLTVLAVLPCISGQNTFETNKKNKQTDHGFRKTDEFVLYCLTCTIYTNKMKDILQTLNKPSFTVCEKKGKKIKYRLSIQTVEYRILTTKKNKLVLIPVL